MTASFAQWGQRKDNLILDKNIIFYVQFVHMLNPKVFNVSEARVNLFKIFKMVASGNEVVIINKDTDQKFKVSLFEDEKSEDDTEAILQDMAKINIKALSPKEIREIILAKYDDKKYLY